MVRKLINKTFRLMGYVPTKSAYTLPPDLAADLDFVAVYSRCRPFTMTSPERMYALYKSVQYVIENGISGNFVECGVWKGGSSMVIALTLLKLGIKDRTIYLYDTFEGMSEPGKEDKSFAGDPAAKLLGQEDKFADSSIWCYSSIDEVKRNMASTLYPSQHIHFVKGKVEDTLRTSKPGKISLLRLDTDWYESTKVELQILYPLLERNGVLIIDDFGHWEGAKKAVVEYFTQMGLNNFLSRIDYTGRLMIKGE